MSDLRERAAIAAMREMVCKLGPGAYHPEDLAIDAVKCADALLAELARTTSPVRPEPLPRAEDAQPSILDLAGVVVCKAEPTAGACTAAERELIETSLYSQISTNFYPWYAAIEAVRAERRAASEAKGGVQP